MEFHFGVLSANGLLLTPNNPDNWNRLHDYLLWRARDFVSSAGTAPELGIFVTGNGQPGSYAVAIHLGPFPRYSYCCRRCSHPVLPNVDSLPGFWLAVIRFFLVELRSTVPVEGRYNTVNLDPNGISMRKLSLKEPYLRSNSAYVFHFVLNNGQLLTVPFPGTFHCLQAFH